MGLSCTGILRSVAANITNISQLEVCLSVLVCGIITLEEGLTQATLKVKSWMQFSHMDIHMLLGVYHIVTHRASNLLYFLFFFHKSMFGNGKLASLGLNGFNVLFIFFVITFMITGRVTQI